MKPCRFLDLLPGFLYIAGLLGCGFFSPENSPQPLWGVWEGPFPRTVSTVADSARWAFTSDGIYLLYALKADGTLISREAGYYTTNGALLTLSQGPGGVGNTEDLYYEVREPRLLLTIRGEMVAYRRVGDADRADDLRNALPKTGRGDR